jgi:hypothetical protein
MEPAMPNVAELIKDHVLLTVECVDRLYLNAYGSLLLACYGLMAFLAQRFSTGHFRKAF